MSVLLWLSWAACVSPAVRQETAQPPGLQARVRFRCESGPLTGALDSIEGQTGVSFSLAEEAIPSGLNVPALSHEGSLSQGLDRLLNPLGLKWAPGELGGIVVVPASLRVVTYAEWLETTLDAERGVGVIEPGEEGQRLGILAGDLLVALNGERMRTALDFHRACSPLPRGSPITFTVRREEKDIPIKATLHIPLQWTGYGLLDRFENAPSPWAIYERHGHRNPSWDGAVKALLDHLREDSLKFRPAEAIRLARECQRLGCRDPLVLRRLVLVNNEFSEERWALFESMVDLERLRTTYGGSLLWLRPWIAETFALHAPLTLRSRLRRRIEAAWAVGPLEDRGVGIAGLRFRDADYDGCIRLADALRKTSEVEPDGLVARLHLQSLVREGRFEEAIRLEAAEAEKNGGKRWSATDELLGQTVEYLKSRPERVRDRLEGPVGLLGWRAFTALDAIDRGRRIRNAGRESDRAHYFTHAFPPALPEAYEVLWFLRVRRGLVDGGSFAGLALNGAEGKPRGGLHVQKDWFSSAQYNVTPDPHLWRWHKGIGVTNLPLPGFANGGSDALRIYKSPEVVTLRVNRVWTTTDAHSSLAVKGELLLTYQHVAAESDVAILVPTKRRYDNDRIRDLLEQVIDPGSSSAPEDRLKLWYEAAALSPPDSMLRALTSWVPGPLRAKIPPPGWPPDAPPLGEMTLAEAKERLEKRGPSVWVRPDPVEKDLVWCARPDGRVEILDRLRYFTEHRRDVRDQVGEDTLVGEPLFEKGRVWLPTSRGLFSYDRQGEVFVQVAVGGVLPGVSIRSLRLKDGALAVETSSAGSWTRDSRAGRWSRE